MTYKKAWGEDRVYFYDEAGRLHHMPVGWTSVVEPDAFLIASSGRCWFRSDDLLRLVDLISKLQSNRKEEA